LRRDALLAIDFRWRETFAYACEVFSRTLPLSPTRQERLRLVEEYAATALPSNQQVETGELIDILREAVAPRNGWARIRARSAPERLARRAGRLPLSTM